MNCRAYVALTLSIVSICCNRQSETGETIARVGDAVLTMNEARKYIDTTQGAFDVQLKRYATYWVNTELVYQEAKRRGIENSEEFNEQLLTVRRQITTQSYLDRYVYSESGELGEETLRKYFDNHAPEFLLREDMIKLNTVTFNSRERASQFAAKVSQGTSWDSACAGVQRDSAAMRSILAVSGPQYYSSHTLFPQELWKVAVGLRQGEISFPVKTSASEYVVMQLLSNLRQGMQADFEISRAEVRQRVLLERRRQRYDELLATLRHRYDAQIFIGHENGGDSAHVHE